jgi:type I restriction enzyme S subunit
MISATDLGTRYPTKPLGELVEFLDHLRKPVTASEREPGPYPYYGANGKQDSVAGYLFDEPLILVAEDGGFFGDPQKTIAYRVNGKCWVNNHAHVLRPKPNVDIGFLCRHLEQYDVRPFTSGTTRLKLNKSQAQRIPIALPPLSEQKRIAAILDNADALRAKRRESNEQLDSLVQATFLEMFGDPVTNPHRWEIKACDDICTKVTDGEHGTVDRLPSGRLYLMARNITASGEIDLGDVSFISEADHRRIFQRCDPEKGDLLLVCVGATIGKTAIVPDMPEFSLARSVALLKPRRNLVQPVYLNQYLRSRHGQTQLLHSRNTAAQSGLYLGKMKAMSIPLPPLDLQTRFASIVESIEQQKARLKAHLAELDTLFASLQSRAFNGELVA